MAIKKPTVKQKLFCKYYTERGEALGNGLQAYAKAYNIDLTKKGKISVAKSSAYRLLTKDYITRYIRKLLELDGLTDNAVDKELLFLIQQNANMNVKLGAIREYNNVRKRIMAYEEPEVKEKVNLTTFRANMEKMTNDELERLA